VNKNKLDYYFDEYVFRYNRRTSTSRGLLFLRLIEQGVKTPPISYKKLSIKITGNDRIPHFNLYKKLIRIR
jgi:hypothetical protein